MRAFTAKRLFAPPSPAGGALCFWGALAGLLTAMFSPGVAQAQEIVPLPRVTLDFSEAAQDRGKQVFLGICNGCHGLKFVRHPATNEPYRAKIDPKTAESSFGKAPPDLSLMAKARRGGPVYIYAFLIGWEKDPGPCTTAGGRNRFFPGGCTAMPNLGISEAQARDVAAYLDLVADPTKEFRQTLGAYVLGFMAVLTVFMYLMYRRVWVPLKREMKAQAAAPPGRAGRPL